MRSWLSTRPARVREGSVSTGRQQRHSTSVPVLPPLCGCSRAIRFREAVKRTIQSLSQNPHVGPRYSSSNPRVQNLRSWPVAGFERSEEHTSELQSLTNLVCRLLLEKKK